MHRQGDIVLVNTPFSDLNASKRRPVLIVSKDEYNNKQQDVIVVAVTSKLTSKDYTVEFDNDDMEQGEILTKSCVRADKIFSLDKSLVIKKFGSVSGEIVSKTVKLISAVIAAPEAPPEISAEAGEDEGVSVVAAPDRPAQ